MKKHNKLICLCLALIFLFSMSACRDEETETEKKPDVTELKIGVLYSEDYEQSLNSSYLFDKSLNKACEELRINEERVIKKTTKEKYSQEIQELIDSGCNIIITASKEIIDSMTGGEDSLKPIVEKSSNVFFLNYGYTDYGFDNQCSFYAKTYEAAYLAGAAAGLKTQSDSIGFLTTFGAQNSYNTSIVNAFSIGVYHVNKNAKVYLSTINTGLDLILETSNTQNLIENYNCDVMASNTFTELSPSASESNGVAYVSYNNVGVTEASRFNMFSLGTDWSVFLTSQFNSIVNGKFENGHKMLGLADDIVYVGKYNEKICDESIIDYVQTAKANIISEKLNIFENVIYDSDGKVMSTASGEVLYSDSFIINNFNMYNFNVVLVN